MSIEHRVGDLLAQTDLAAIGHGVNLKGVMGAGIAVGFKRIWPDMFTAYQAACASGQLTLGGMQAWRAASGVWIYNLATQPYPGPHARLDAVATSLNAALAHAQAHRVRSLGLPHLGAGHGGLLWDAVLGVIDDIASRWPTHVVVVEYPPTAHPAGHQGRPGSPGAGS